MLQCLSKVNAGTCVYLFKLCVMYVIVVLESELMIVLVYIILIDHGTLRLGFRFDLQLQHIVQCL